MCIPSPPLPSEAILMDGEIGTVDMSNGIAIHFKNSESSWTLRQPVHTAQLRHLAHAGRRDDRGLDPELRELVRHLQRNRGAAGTRGADREAHRAAAPAGVVHLARELLGCERSA